MIFASGDITEFMSIDLTTIIATLLNTLILFLVLKHFLFDKVNKVVGERQKEIQDSYDRAEEAEKNAQKLEADYNEKIGQAKQEGAEIIRDATKKAQARADEIIDEARVEAKGIRTNAENEIEREKKIAVNAIKDEISQIAFSAAAAVVEKDLTSEDNEKLIEKFIDNVGEV
ncbi:MAG: F0F1 ATP synthase subunit B [Ruminococcus sp.]|jgi:F-type H+-transporting ATPase subunit b|nr:F0F1 ATP synthase subunit B [Ruminococcus sp.]MBQ1904464.1 F0F1 ATP synthase subunit B [Ruminococcus sp.]MBQ3937687.1 F0F1 ATP synthase subunit B [Ruminococcus sp.]